MRHNFVNDIGDYAKYALLRALCHSTDPPLSLGVVWYLTEHEERNGDGRRRSHLSDDGWDSLDPDLLTRMRAIEPAQSNADQLHLNLVEQSEILPPGTVYFSTALPDFSGSRDQRIARRAQWFSEAKKAVAGCNLIFLDPDNGLEVKSAPPGSRFSGKYATVSEVAELVTLGVIVVLYQHCDRSPWLTQRAKIHRKLSEAIGRQMTFRSLRFGAFGARAFFCLSADPVMGNTMDTALGAFTERITSWDKAHTFRLE